MNDVRTTSEKWGPVWSVSRPGKRAAEQHLAILALGIVRALQQERMSVEDAWENGLNFKTYMGMKERKADRRLLKVWEWAMELPQVAKIGKDALGESYTRMEQLAADVLSLQSKRYRRRTGSPLKSHGMTRKASRITPAEIKAAIKDGRL